MHPELAQTDNYLPLTLIETGRFVFSEEIGREVLHLYNDLAKLLAAGTTREGYTAAEIADQLARYQYTMPETRLSTYLTGVYGAPSGSVQERPIYENPSQQGLGSLLSLAGTAGSLGWKPFA